MEGDFLRKEILKKYKTLGDFAAKVGISKSQLSRWIKKPTPNFYAILENSGIEIKNKEMFKEEKGKENTIEFVETLKEVIHDKNNTIEQLKKIIEQKDQIIKQYEEINRLFKERSN